MPETADTTELQAVNEILDAVGDEGTLTTLTSSSPKEALAAQRLLVEVSKEIQGEGWYFNTDRHVELVPDAGDGEIDLDIDVMHIDGDPDYPESYKLPLAKRGLKLWHKEENTFDLSTYVGTFYARIVRYLPLSDMPEPFRRWVIATAKARYAARQMMERPMVAVLTQEMNEARVRARKDELDQADANIFTANTPSRSAVWRRRPQGGPY